MLTRGGETEMITRRSLLKNAGAAAFVSACWARAGWSVEAETKAPAAQKITKIEPFILRSPPERDKPEDYFISMPPVAQMTGGKALSYRLDHAETVRQGGYRQTLLVKVTTDQGIVGWGEAHAVMTPRVVRSIVTDLFTPLLIGQDARNVEVLWEKMYSTQRLRGYNSGFFKRAMSGIDIALWDILGKAAGMPVYQLMGGKFRDTIPTYAGVGGRTISQLRERAHELIEKGYTTMKMGLSKGGPHTADIQRVVAVSEVMGDKGQVLVDSLGAYKLHEATTVGRELDQLGNIGWWEDVLMPEDIDGYARLAEALDVPICAGEQYSNRFQFRDLFAARAVDIINPDVARVGLTESKRVAIMADVHNVLLSPHCSMGTAPYRTASIHLCACTPNAVILEGGESHLRPFGNQLLVKPLGYRGGYVEVPEAPGLGVEFDEKELQKLVVD